MNGTRSKQLRRMTKALGVDPKEAVYFEKKVSTKRGVKTILMLEATCGRHAYKATKKGAKKHASLVERI